MPKHIEIDVFLIGKTAVDREEVRRWLNYLEANGYEIPEQEAVTDPALLIALAAKRCYKSFEPGLNPNVTKVRTDLVEYIDNILASGHGSVFEHAVYNFAIEGVSRVFTGEMNRHRAGWAISEGSMRYIRFDKDIPYWVPNSIRENPDDNADLAERKRATREIFDRAFGATEEFYKELLDVWDMEEGSHNFHYKKRVTSCLRRIVGMGVATGGVWSGNMRALRHVITMRADQPSAEEEIFHVFSKVAELMIASEPMLFGDFEKDASGSWKPKYKKV